MVFESPNGRIGVISQDSNGDDTLICIVTVVAVDEYRYPPVVVDRNKIITLLQVLENSSHIHSLVIENQPEDNFPKKRVSDSCINNIRTDEGYENKNEDTKRPAECRTRTIWAKTSTEDSKATSENAHASKRDSVKIFGNKKISGYKLKMLSVFWLLIMMTVWWNALTGPYTVHGSCLAIPETVEIVPSCPMNENDWKAAEAKKNCSGIHGNCGSTRYHCVLSNYRNETVEVCAKTRILFGYCAEYNRRGRLIQRNNIKCVNHVNPCNEPYASNEGYKVPECYDTKWRVKETILYQLPNTTIQTPQALREINDGKDTKESLDRLLILLSSMIIYAAVLFIIARRLFR